MQSGSLRLSIDVGGTFTDVVLWDSNNAQAWFAKVLSTPSDPSIGSLDGARAVLARSAVAISAVGDVVHATTVATNAVLEGKGARTGLLTTAGFRDALEMGREARYDVYDLDIRMPPPLVPRRRRLEVNERVSFSGEVLATLDAAEVTALVRQLVEQAQIESLAICLLHGYIHPQHERQIADIARSLFPDLAVSVSHQVSAEVREFERVSTTVVDAAVKPLVRNYVSNLNAGLKAIGINRDVAMMLSHGGIGAASDVANLFPVRMIESGPAAGAIAAGHYARQALVTANAIAFDMGGTTAKISVIKDGVPATTREYEVGQVRRFKRGSGYPLQISAIELLEIGAGGGSIARLSDLGLLRVGPASAGAEPGPVSYGAGGTEPTVTDADLILGYLDPAHFLSGEMALDQQAATDSLWQKIAQPLAMTVTQVAWGIHDVVNESMAAATRAHAAEKGIDLRDYAMIAFGGAGPVHAYALARKLGLRRVVCPFGAGVASAIGCLAAPPGIDLVTPHFGLLDELDWAVVDEHFSAMRARSEASLTQLIGDQDPRQMESAIDIRCQGQGYDVTVPVVLPRDGSTTQQLRSAFSRIYRDVYGHAPPNVPLEAVSLRARVFSPRADFALRSSNGSGVAAVRAANAVATPDASAPDEPGLKGRRPVYFEVLGDYTDTAVYNRYQLRSATKYSGPAVIEERETSIITGPDTTFHVDPDGNVVIDFAG